MITLLIVLLTEQNETNLSSSDYTTLKITRPDSATCKWDPPTENLCFAFKLKNEPKEWWGLRLDVYGDLSAGLPSGGTALMGMFLPLKSGRIAGNVHLHLQMSSSAPTTGNAKIDCCTIEMVLSHVGESKIKSILQKQIDAGDPIIVLEVLNNDQNGKTDEVLITVPTKASLILKAMKDTPSNIIISAATPGTSNSCTRNTVIRSFMIFETLNLPGRLQ